jgi:iron complex outermembrane receptor protein
VTGEGQRGYRVPNASTATKTDTPLRDIPQSIQVIPQEVLRDQNITRVEDALRNVSGVTPTIPSGSTPFSGYTIRGFTTSDFSNNVLRDGLQDPRGLSATRLTNIERIELLRGPASVLFGSGNPGATINLITKKPLSDPFYEISASVGSYDFYQGAIDLSGPLNDSKSVLYRLNASYSDAGSSRDFVGIRNIVVVPVLSWAISKSTNLTLQGEFNDVDNVYEAGQPAVGTVLPNPNGRIARNFYAGEPNSKFYLSVSRVGYRLDHSFSENWSLRNAFQATLYREFRSNTIFPTSLASNNRTLNRTYQDSPYEENSYNFITDIIGKFSTGSVNHQLVFGVNLNRIDLFNFTRPTGTAAPLDLFNPVYGRSPLSPKVPTFDRPALTDSLGVYIQDQVELAENLKLLLGVRFDTFKQTANDRIANRELDNSGDAFSPRVGIVYQPVPPISLYASYSRSFTPPSVTAIAFDGGIFQPERGEQYEVGVKADLSNRLSATLAFYDLTRSNVLATDNRLGIPPGFSIQTGEQRSRGIELNLAGEILPGWNIIAGYSYNDARITKDTTLAIDNRLNNAPENTFNLWTTYEIQQGALQGLEFGLGFFFVGERQGDLANTFQVPSYFRTDASISYKRGQFRAALNFRNLFDVEYFESALSRVRLYPGDPFTVQATVGWQF